jgi:hypothetical protein
MLAFCSMSFSLQKESDLIYEMLKKTRCIFILGVLAQLFIVSVDMLLVHT